MPPDNTIASTPRHRLSARHPLWQAAAMLTLLYFLAAVFSLFLSRSPGSIASLWYPNALAIAVAVHRPWRQLPVVLLAAGAGNLLANIGWGDAWTTAIWFVPPNLLEIALATAMLKRVGLDHKNLEDPIHLTLLLVLGCGVAPVAGAVLGSVLLSPQLDLSSIAVAWPWVAGAVVGGSSAMPLAFLLQRHGLKELLSIGRSTLFWGLLTCSAGITLVVYAYLPFPFVYTTIPLMVAAMTLPMMGTALVTLGVSAILGSLLAFGVFVPPPSMEEWQQLFVYLAFAAALIPAQILSAAQSATHQAKIHLAQSAASLRQVNQGLQQFIHMASHDMREPINTVSQFSGLLVEAHTTQLPESSRKHLQRIVGGADRMRKLLDDVVQFATLSQQTVIQAAPVHLSLCLQKVCHQLAPVISRRQVSFKVQNLPTVQGDPVQLELLLYHLVSNALQFMPPDRTPVIDIQSRTEGNMAVITLTDNGIGINPAFTERLFEPFVRLHTRQQNGGSGLGLAVCRQIARLHRGRIDIRPTDGQGTQIELSLPLQ